MGTNYSIGTNGQKNIPSQLPGGKKKKKRRKELAKLGLNHQWAGEQITTSGLRARGRFCDQSARTRARDWEYLRIVLSLAITD